MKHTIPTEDLLNRVTELEERNRHLEEAITHLTYAARDVAQSLGGTNSRTFEREVKALRDAVVWADALKRQS